MANVPITSLPQASTVAKTDQLILQGNSTQRATLAKILADLGVVNPDTAQDDMLQLTTPAGAAAHNCVYRGKALGGSVTSEQWAAIKAGTFKNLYLGDYWSIGGMDYIIAAFDYWYKCGDTACNTHHAVVIPRSHLYIYKFNPTNTTEGGYVGSDLYKNGLTQAKTTINTAFGSAHILNHRESLVNAAINGAPTGTDWYDSTVELMNENNSRPCRTVRLIRGAPAGTIPLTRTSCPFSSWLRGWASFVTSGAGCETSPRNSVSRLSTATAVWAAAKPAVTIAFGLLSVSADKGKGAKR